MGCIEQLCTSALCRAHCAILHNPSAQRLRQARSALPEKIVVALQHLRALNLSSHASRSAQVARRINHTRMLTRQKLSTQVMLQVCLTRYDHMLARLCCLASLHCHKPSNLSKGSAACIEHAYLSSTHIPGKYRCAFSSHCLHQCLHTVC